MIFSLHLRPSVNIIKEELLQKNVGYAMKAAIKFLQTGNNLSSHFLLNQQKTGIFIFHKFTNMIRKKFRFLRKETGDKLLCKRQSQTKLDR